MQVQTVSTSKDSSRKTAKKEQVTPKPPAKKRGMPKGAKGILSSTELAQKKTKLHAPKKKPSRAAKLLLSGALAAGIAAAPSGAEARAPELVDLTAPSSYIIVPPLVDASSTESISYLLSSLKAETDKYRKSSALSIFEIALSQGGKLTLKMNQIDRILRFTVLQPGSQRRSFEFSFSELSIINPEVRIEDQGEKLVVRLLDSRNGRHARIIIPKVDVDPDKIRIKVFDDSAELYAARQVFHYLHTFPEPVVDPKRTESRVFMEALKAAENLLVKQTQHMEFSSSGEEKKTAFEHTVDTFISLYSIMGYEAVDKLSAGMEGLSREEKGRIVEFALPRFTALMLRPFAAWQGSLGKLDKLFSSPDFSIEALREFAWHNNLHQEYNFLLKSLRESLSS